MWHKDRTAERVTGEKEEKRETVRERGRGAGRGAEDGWQHVICGDTAVSTSRVRVRVSE